MKALPVSGDECLKKKKEKRKKETKTRFDGWRSSVQRSHYRP